MKKPILNYIDRYHIRINTVRGAHLKLYLAVKHLQRDIDKLRVTNWIFKNKWRK